MSFDKIFKSYMDQYIEHKKIELKLDVIKQGIKNHYEKQEERLLKVNGVVARTKSKKEYQIKEEIYDFLEDYGYLPLVVKINKSIEQHFNLEKAKMNHKKSIRLYTGGQSIVDKDSIIKSYSHYLDYGLDELAEEFKRVSTEEKLAKAKLEEIKEQLINAMPSSSVATEFGTLKLTESYDYDLNIVFDGVSGKKEIFIKKNDDHYEVVIYPEDKTFRVSGDHIFGDKTVEELYLAHNNEAESIFVKKRPFKKFIKEGYVFNRFEVEVDPYEFFRHCEISKTKINDLIQQGIIEEKDIKPYLELVDESQYIEVLSEGSLEQQSNIYHQKLLERSENYRRRRESNYKENVSHSSSQTSTVDFTDFSF
jgi:molybdopterin biosynthesis enzyme MoaB